MNFYQKNVGRPTTDELALIDAITQVVEEQQIPMEIIPWCESLEDLVTLKQFVDAYESETVENDQPTHQDEGTENDPVEQPAESGQTEPENNELQDGELLEAIPEGVSAIVGDEAPDFVAADYDPFADPIIERSYTGGANPTQTTTGDAHPYEPEEIELEEAKEKTPLDDLPPQTKKRAAEQTADAILKGYARLVPEPFKWLSKIPEEKVERMAFDGELDVSIEVSEGLTFDDYMRQTNEQIDEIFEVQEDTIAEIREPLIEVLMEQELELTPTQRLTMAVLSHLIQMLTVALKLRKQNNRILSYQQHLTHLSRTHAA